MLQYGNLTLIGTSHISVQSKQEVQQAIRDIQPEFVAIELDLGRLHALLGKKQKLRIRDVRKLGVRGFLFTLAGAWIEERLGKMVGTKPGSEMKAAVREAAKIKAKVVLIDQNINITIRRLLKKITWKEKFRFIRDLFAGIVLRRQDIEQFDLRKVPPKALIEKLINQVRVRYPSVYTVLIAERNTYMARKLVRVMKEQPQGKIVAVVGAGHEKGMMEIIQKAL